jgi:hypothetical protein
MCKFENKISRLARPLISAAVIVGLLTANAQATVVSSLEGVVSVNRGNGFKPASIGLPLEPGDRIRTGEGSANILYDNGCATKIGPQQVAIVYSEPPVCNGGGLKDGVVMSPAEPEAGVDPLIAGGLLAGAAAGLAAALASSSKSSCVSP